MVLLSSRRVFVYDQVLLSQVKSQLARLSLRSKYDKHPPCAVTTLPLK
jgi:hypothetical protein